MQDTTDHADYSGKSGSYQFFFLSLGIFLIITTISSFYSYLLFHTIAELFSIIIAFTVFIIAWNCRDTLENGFILFVGIASFFMAVLDLVHTLAFKGMNIFICYDTNLPTQLWVAARFLQAGTLIIAPFFLAKKCNPFLQLIVYGVVTTFLLCSIFTGLFPVCYIEGEGQTPFKILSEYLISGLLIIAFFLLYMHRDAYDRDILSLLLGSIIATIISELAFTFYVGVYDFSNLLGHICKIIAFSLLYKALIETGFNKPLDLLYRNLKKSEKKFRVFFTHMSEEVGIYRILKDDAGKPYDYLIVDANPRFIEEFPDLKRSPVGMTGREIYSSDISPPALERYAGIIESGEPVRFELNLPDVRVYSLVSAFRLDLDHIAVLSTDISRQKMSETALRNANSQLKILNSITRHDILNNVNTAYALIGLIQSGREMQSDDPLCLLEKVMDGIVEKINFSRDYQTLGTQEPGWERPDRYIREKKLSDHRLSEIEIDISSECIEIYADPMMGSVFENFLDNSLRHGKKVTHIRLSGNILDDSFVLVYEDNGIGVPDEKKETIFEPSYERRYGHGLYFVREILMLTGIKIREAGIYGKGARFEIIIPPDKWRVCS